MGNVPRPLSRLLGFVSQKSGILRREKLTHSPFLAPDWQRARDTSLYRTTRVALLIRSGCSVKSLGPRMQSATEVAS